MRLLYYSIDESFNPDNPLARTFLGVGRRWRRRAPMLIRRSLLAFVCAVWAIAGFSHFFRPNQYSTAWAALLSILILAFISAAAPFVGQLTRKGLDRHPMTGELKVTPLSERDKLAVVHGRILQWLSIPASVAVVFFLSIQFIILRQWLVGTPRYETMPWAMLLMSMLCVANWMAGCYLRATFLATTRFRFWAAFLGPTLVLLMAAAALWIQIQSGVVPMTMFLDIKAKWASVALSPRVTFTACDMVLLWLIARLAAAAFCWRMAIKGARRMAELERLHGTAPKRKLPFFC